MKPNAIGRSRLAKQYGPWAVVTGASSGIGRACARHLARTGFGVVLVARRAVLLEELAVELAHENSIETRVIAADLSTSAGVAAVSAATEQLDVGLLVASAGFGSSGPFLDTDPLAEAQMIDVNVRALMLLAHAFGQRFRARGRGGLVLMSSIVAFQGVPNAANYAATKGYVQSLSEALRLELASQGIDVIASAPGPVESGFADRASMRMGATVAPDLVARRTLDLLGRRGTVRPGLLSKLLGWSLSCLHRSGRVRVMGKVMAGMVDPARRVQPGISGRSAAAKPSS